VASEERISRQGWEIQSDAFDVDTWTYSKVSDLLVSETITSSLRRLLRISVDSIRQLSRLFMNLVERILSRESWASPAFQHQSNLNIILI
jgi:hypothetical protein